MSMNDKKPSKRSILGSMGRASRASQEPLGDAASAAPTSIRNRSGSAALDDVAEADNGGSTSGGRLRTFRKKQEQPSQEQLPSQSDARRTNYSKRASSIPSGIQDIERAETADEVKSHAQQHLNGDKPELPAALAGGGYLDENVPSYDLKDPTKTTPAANGSTVKNVDTPAEQSNGGGSGLLAAATGGVSAALAGAGSLLGRGGGTVTQEVQGDSNAEQDPEVPNQDMEQFDDAKPADRGDAKALIEEERRQVSKHTKEQSKPFDPRHRGKRTDKVPALTPVQRHYLLKALVSIQMQNEWSELEKLGALTQYGFPFSLERPKLKRVKDKNLQLEGEFAKGEFAEAADDPYADVDDDEIRRQENLMEPLILRHMFHVHLHTFPGLDKAPLKYWQKRIQPFFDEMAARNFSTSIERTETSARHFYTLAMTRYLGGFFARGVGVRGEGELRGPGKGEPGTDRWGKGKEWGKGTVKRGLDKPARPDGELMDRIDELFNGREGELWRRARKETSRIKGDWRSFKEFNIETEGGVEETMAYLDIGNMRNLPPHFRNAEEYARHHAAYIFHTLFVNSPNADSFYNILRGIHFLFPYWGAKQLLKVANAQTMISGILNLLLARPAGAKSLVQRIFVSVIGGQASSINKEYVQPLRKEIGDTELCSKLDDYVKRGNRPEGKAIRNRAVRMGQDVLATIFLNATGPQLSQSKKNEVLDLHDSFARSPYRGTLNAAYPPSTPAGKASDKPRVASNWTNDRDEQREAVKYAMLKLYLRALLQRRDREQACQMASGSLIPTIIKDSLDTVFYGPIKSIAEHSDLASRLGDLQAFFDDIIKTRKNSENTLPDWIALTARHENSLYFLFHECAAIVQPFTQWLQGGADFMALSTTDPNHPANRKAKNIEVNLEDLLQDESLTEQDVDEIIHEADQLATYVKWQKVWYELEMRKNFLLSRGDAIPSSGLCQDDVPSGMRQRIEDVDGLLLDLMQEEGIEAEDGVVRSDVRGTEMLDFPWAWFDAVDPLHQHLNGTDPTAMSYEPKTVSARLPSLKHTRKALDAFQAALADKMPAWREGDEKGVPATSSRAKAAAAGYASSSTKAPSVAEQSTTTSAPSKSRFKMPFMGRS